MFRLDGLIHVERFQEWLEAIVDDEVGRGCPEDQIPAFRNELQLAFLSAAPVMGHS